MQTENKNTTQYTMSQTTSYLHIGEKNEIGIKQYSSSPSTKRMTTRLVISAVSIINSIISVAVDKVPTC